jgi:hypothetical protein
MVEQLKYKDPDVRQAALEAIVKLARDGQFVSYSFRCASDAPQVERPDKITKALQTIVESLTNEDGCVRQTALNAIARLASIRQSVHYFFTCAHLMPLKQRATLAFQRLCNG